MECLFCKSYRDCKDKGLVIYENDEAYSVLNYKPSHPGHALIITKRHVSNLRELTGPGLEGFVHAIPETFETIKRIYDKDPEEIAGFYQSLVREPPEPESRDFAEQMLKHPHLREKPTAFNWGMNNGFDAGQREKHIHIHLFPRRGGLGIATAMRKHLAEV